MAYEAGRGFTGNQVLSNSTTLGQLASMNAKDYGFSRFWEGRSELGATPDYRANWLTLNRPDIKEGSGKLRVASPMRGAQRTKAAFNLEKPEYKQWGKEVAPRMGWGGQVRQEDPQSATGWSKTSGAELAKPYNRSLRNRGEPAAAREWGDPQEQDISGVGTVSPMQRAGALRPGTQFDHYVSPNPVGPSSPFPSGDDYQPLF